MKVVFDKCKPQGLCAICGLPKSDMRASLQVGWFRGDDVVYKVHSTCKKDLIKKLNKDSIWTTH